MRSKLKIYSLKNPTWESAITLVAKWFILHLASTDNFVGVCKYEGSISSSIRAYKMTWVGKVELPLNSQCRTRSHCHEQRHNWPRKENDDQIHLMQVYNHKAA